MLLLCTGRVARGRVENGDFCGDAVIGGLLVCNGERSCNGDSRSSDSESPIRHRPFL